MVSREGAGVMPGDWRPGVWLVALSVLHTQTFKDQRAGGQCVRVSWGSSCYVNNNKIVKKIVLGIINVNGILLHCMH